MQSDQHSGARAHWRRVIRAEYVKKKKIVQLNFILVLKIQSNPQTI
jgi:hypothetical protein